MTSFDSLRRSFLRTGAFGTSQGGAQVTHELASVGQRGERVVLREMLELPSALVDALFELRLVVAHLRARRVESLRHVVERRGEQVELPHAAAGKWLARRAVCQFARHANHAADRPNDTANGVNANEQE